MRARVIGLGQPVAGDDGAGIAVLRHLRAKGPPPGVEIVEARDASALLELLQTPARVIVVDAALAQPPGRVLELGPEALAAGAPASLSSHGVGVGEAIALARELAPDDVSPDVRLVAIAIDRPACHGEALSPDVAAAIPVAAERVLALVAS